MSWARDTGVGPTWVLDSGNGARDLHWLVGEKIPQLKSGFEDHLLHVGKGTKGIPYIGRDEQIGESGKSCDVSMGKKRL